jgi:DNA-directed RNA polymerase subunit RPC12/RpoP
MWQLLVQVSRRRYKNQCMEEVKIKLDKKNIKRKKYSLLSFIIGAMFFVLLLKISNPFIAFFIFVLILLIFHRIIYGVWGLGYKCSECNNKLKQITWPLKHGETVYYQCSNCKILWDLNITHHDT